MASPRSTLLIFTLAASAVIGAFFGSLAGFSVTQKTGIVAEITEQLGIELPPASEEEAVERTITKMLEEESATISVVHQVLPAVVSVVIKKDLESLINSGSYFFFDDEGMVEDFGSEFVEIGGGTAFFVTSDGLLLTNKHVVSDPNARYSIITNDGDEYSVEVVAQDVFLDLAVIEVNDEGAKGMRFPTVEFGNSGEIEIGQTVIAIGNTLSEYRNTVTKGVISGIGRRVVAGDYYATEVIEEAIQTDAAINPGNSGGPLINLYGEVIGVNTAISSDGQGINFAIPIDSAKKIVDDVVEFGRIIRPWLGVRYLMIDEWIAEENGLEVSEGALVVSGSAPDDFAIVPGGPAEEAGIQEGDIIVAIDGNPVTQDNTLAKLINTFEPGDVVGITLLRDGNIINLSVVLAELNPVLFD